MGTYLTFFLPPCRTNKLASKYMWYIYIIMYRISYTWSLYTKCTKNWRQFSHLYLYKYEIFGPEMTLREYSIILKLKNCLRNEDCLSFLPKSRHTVRYFFWSSLLNRLQGTIFCSEVSKVVLFEPRPHEFASDCKEMQYSYSLMQNITVLQ